MTKLFKGSRHDHVAAPSTESLAARHEHAELRERIRHLRNSVDRIADEPVGEQRKRLDDVMAWLDEHIELHTRYEERVLYPMIEAHVGAQPTAALRVEHRFIDRRIEELRRLTAEPTPPVALFLRLFDGLIGVFDAHFEAEEAVLSPLVDQLKERGVAAAQPSP